MAHNLGMLSAVRSVERVFPRPLVPRVYCATGSCVIQVVVVISTWCSSEGDECHGGGEARRGEARRTTRTTKCCDEASCFEQVVLVVVA